MKLEYTAITDRGAVRSENQDTLFLPTGWVNENTFETTAQPDAGGPLLFAVFDGMGGALCGKEASVLAARELEKQTKTEELDALCFSMNESICQYMQENDVKTMGTTVAMVRFDDETLTYCNVGDSRIYLIQSLSMYRLSKDHTVSAFAGRRVLTQHLGIPPKEMLIEPHLGSVPVKSGDVVLLCSDGLTDLLSEAEIGKIIVTHPCMDAAQTLREAALQHGGKDNISIILIQIQ